MTTKQRHIDVIEAKTGRKINKSILAMKISFCLFVWSSVFCPWNLLSHSQRGSTWRRAGLIVPTTTHLFTYSRFECRAIDKHKAESEKHRAAVRRRRSALRDADVEDIDDIVGVYTSHNEVRYATAIYQPNSELTLELD